MTRRRAFTLIELLVVMTIIALLSGMLMAVLSIATRAGRRSNSESILRTVHAALRMFQQDVRVVPYQTYPDQQVSPETPAANGLARRLGHTLTDAERTALNATVGAAARKFAYRCNLATETEGATQPSALTYLRSDVGWAYGTLILGWFNENRSNQTELAYTINRLATQRARQAVLAGAMSLPGPLIAQPGGTVPVRDKTATPLLTAAEYDTSVVGWCDDYLEGALEAKRVVGDDVVDAYGNPVVLISQLVPQVKFNTMQIGWGSISGVDSAWFGLGGSGFRPGSGPWSSLIAAQRWRLLSLGRVRLTRNDAGDGQPTPTDAACFPDASDLYASDRRFYAAPGHEEDLELWSAGPNGTMRWMRNVPANALAIPFLPIYDRGLR